MRTLLTILTPGQAPDVMLATATSIERGGLYSVVVVLMGVCSALFWLREKDRDKWEKDREKEMAARDAAQVKSHDEFQKLQDGFQRELLRLIEAQTAVITKQAMLTEKVEGLLVRVLDRLARERKED